MSNLTNPIIGNLGSGLGSEMSAAQGLLGSSDPSSQLQGQALMNQVMQQFNSISTFLKDLADMAQNAIQNSKQG